MKDLIYAKFGTVKQIKQHLFPSTRLQVDDEKVEKFVNKYAKWLGTKIDKSEDIKKYINKDVIKTLLNQEVAAKKKRQSINARKENGVRIRTRTASSRQGVSEQK